MAYPPKDIAEPEAASLDARADRVLHELNRHPHRALVWCDEALADPRSSADDSAHARLLLLRARALHWLGRNEECQAMLGEVLEEARLAGRPALLGVALSFSAARRQDAGDFVGASDLASQALELGLEHRDAEVITRALCMVASLSSWLGWHEQAMRFYDAALLAAAAGDDMAPARYVGVLRCHALLSQMLDEYLDSRYETLKLIGVRFHAELARARAQSAPGGQPARDGALEHLNQFVRWVEAEQAGDTDGIASLAHSVDPRAPLEPVVFGEYRRLAAALACIHCADVSEAIAGLNRCLKDIPDEQSATKVLILRSLADAHARAGDWRAAHDAHRAFEAAQRARLDERARRHVNALIDRVQRDGAHAHAFVSHDLRSPLTAIIGATEAAGRGSPEEAQEALALVGELADRALHYTDEYLRYADLQSLGRSQFEMLSVAEVVSAAAAEVQHGLAVASARITVHVANDDDEAPMQILSHRGTLHRLVVNLLTNAVRAAPAGSVVEANSHTDGRRIVIDVRDQGPGLPTDALLMLVTGRPAPLRAAGTGLGLRYVVEAAAMLGAALFAANQPDSGARVTVALPRA
jgi:signal transduction histidine kinase